MWSKISFFLFLLLNGDKWSYCTNIRMLLRSFFIEENGISLKLFTSIWNWYDHPLLLIKKTKQVMYTVSFHCSLYPFVCVHYLHRDKRRLTISHISCSFIIDINYHIKKNNTVVYKIREFFFKNCHYFVLFYVSYWMYSKNIFLFKVHVIG